MYHFANNISTLHYQSKLLIPFKIYLVFFFTFSRLSFCCGIVASFQIVVDSRASLCNRDHDMMHIPWTDCEFDASFYHVLLAPHPVTCTCVNTYTRSLNFFLRK